jgi:Spy/CpxP family protein refolding chaperone
MRSSWLAVLVFVLGVVAGVGSMAFVCPSVHNRLTGHHPPKNPQEFVQDMNKRLDLTPAQSAQFQTIVTGAMQRFDDFHKRVEPEFERIQTEERQRVLGILTPEQQVKFNLWLSEVDKEHKRGKPF